MDARNKNLTPLIASGWPSSTRAQEPSVKVSVFASKLVNPRGLKFGPDGYLYVAEAGSPAGVPLEAPAGLGGDCSAGANGPGNYFGSAKGPRISRIDANGNVTTFVDRLPSSEAGGFASGVADVAFIGNTMYAILAGFWGPRSGIANGRLATDREATVSY